MISFLIALTLPASASMQSPEIQITANIPKAPEEMPLYRLSPTSAPVGFLNERLRAAKLSGLKLDRARYILRSSGGAESVVRAHIELKSGDTEFIPSLAELVRTAGQTKLAGERAMMAAENAYTDTRFIPRDATQLRAVPAIPVMGGQTTKGGRRTAPMTVMTMVPAERWVAGHKVYGLGSHAVVTFANNGTMVGAVRRWKMATAAERLPTLMAGQQVQVEIERQLKPVTASKGTQALVDKVELAYYDNNKDWLQPVYHFEATVTPPTKRISPIRVSGFIPIGKPLEPIPDLAAKPTGKMPIQAKQPRSNLVRGGIGSPPTPDDITLGEYANRDWHNDGGYVSMSNSFLAGLTFLDSIFPWWTPPVTRTQWYEAWPWEVVGPNSRYYMNAVNVAYTVPHGDWLDNTTLRNDSDDWYVPNIGTGGNPGFGAASGGVLATWIIMSCEVIPSFYDRANEAGGSGNGYDAFNPWWPVFQGMHNAIGFRTIMFYPDNSLQWNFGYAASLGGDINATWFQEVAACEGGVGTYPSQHLTGAPQVHYDRASTMIDSRNLGQSIFNVTAQSAASSMWSFWMGN